MSDCKSLINSSNNNTEGYNKSYDNMKTFQKNKSSNDYDQNNKIDDPSILMDSDNEYSSDKKQKDMTKPVRRHNFSNEEDIVILNEAVKYISNHLKPNWKLIGEKISRSSRQVRQRFHIIGSSNNETWTKEEIQILLIAEHAFGPNNAMISSTLGSKFPHQVKKILQLKKKIELSNNKTKMMIECDNTFKKYLPFQDDELIQRLSNPRDINFVNNQIEDAPNMAFQQNNQHIFLNGVNQNQTKPTPTISELYSNMIGIPYPKSQKIETEQVHIPISQAPNINLYFPPIQVNLNPIPIYIPNSQILPKSPNISIIKPKETDAFDTIMPQNPPISNGSQTSQKSCTNVNRRIASTEGNPYDISSLLV